MKEGDWLWHNFSPDLKKKLWQNYHNGLGVLSSSMYMTGLWADKQKQQQKHNFLILNIIGGGGGGSDAPVPPFSPLPHMALHLITLISHKPWVPYYQTLSSINIHLYGNIPKLTLDLWPTSTWTSQIWPSVYNQDSYQTIPQLDTPTWSYNFMYYGIVLVHRVCTL